MTYTDANGAEWLILEGGKSAIGVQRFFGTPSPTGARRYDPLPPDTDELAGAGLVRAAIEQYAREHRADLALLVQASPDRSGLILLALALALILADE